MDSLKITDMRVGQFNLLEFEREGRDWQLAHEHATFSHREACEFIFYLGADLIKHLRTMAEYKELGFSRNFLSACAEAYEKGFTYVCFYY